MKPFYLAASLVAGVAAVAGAAALAVTGAFPLPGASDEVRSAASTGHGTQVDATATANGVSLALVGVVADSTQLVLSIRVTGKEELGSHVSFGPTFLHSDSGEAVPLSRSSSDPADPRTISLTFPALATGAGKWNLTVSSLDFRNLTGAPRSVTTNLELPFEARIEMKEPPAATLSSSQRVDVGHGAAVVDRIVFAPTGIVVTGHLEGFARDDIPALDLTPSMSDSQGTALVLVGGRSGYGENNAAFEFRFKPGAAPAAKFALAFAVSPLEQVREMVGADAIARLGAAAGAAAEWTFAAP